MARFRIGMVDRVMPDWVITVDALIAALLIHAVLFVLAGHRPETRSVSAPRSPGVTLCTRSGLPADEWRNLMRWSNVHNPAMIARADPVSGYVALLEKGRERSIVSLRAETPLPKPQLPPLPGYVPLRRIELADPVFYHGGAFEERAFLSPKPIVLPAVRDDGGSPLQLEGLAVPATVRRALRPTVISVWCTSGVMRHTLVESSGVPELDRAALQAVAGKEFKERKSILVYWPDQTEAKEAPAS